MEWNCKNIDLSAGFFPTKSPANSSIWIFPAELALYKVKTKQRKGGDNELVHHGHLNVKIRLQYHWVKLWKYRPVSWFDLKLSTCKFVNLTISGGIGPTQSQDKTALKGRGMMNCFTTVLFHAEIRLQDYWVKLWIYRPISWFLSKRIYCKSVILTISGGIGPTESQDKAVKKEMVNCFTTILFDVQIRLQGHWLKLQKYRPIRLLLNSRKYRKWINLTILGGIGPI